MLELATTYAVFINSAKIILDGTPIYVLPQMVLQSPWISTL